MPHAIVWLICREYGLRDSAAEEVWGLVKECPPGDLLEDTRAVIRDLFPTHARDLSI